MARKPKIDRTCPACQSRTQCFGKLSGSAIVEFWACLATGCGWRSDGLHAETPEEVERRQGYKSRVE